MRINGLLRPWVSENSMEEHGSTVVENFSLFVDTMKTTGLQAIRYSKHSNETSEGDQSSPPPTEELPASLTTEATDPAGSFPTRQ